MDWKSSPFMTPRGERAHGRRSAPAPSARAWGFLRRVAVHTTRLAGSRGRGLSGSPKTVTGTAWRHAGARDGNLTGVEKVTHGYDD